MLISSVPLVVLTLVEAILALEKMSDCSLETLDSKDVHCSSENIHGLICLAAQLAFEVTITRHASGCHHFKLLYNTTFSLGKKLLDFHELALIIYIFSCVYHTSIKSVIFFIISQSVYLFSHFNHPV